MVSSGSNGTRLESMSSSSAEDSVVTEGGEIPWARLSPGPGSMAATNKQVAATTAALMRHLCSMMIGDLVVTTCPARGNLCG